MIRSTILALFLGTGIASICQSVVITANAPKGSEENRQRATPCGDGKTIAPDLSILSSAQRNRRSRLGLPGKWHWDHEQVNSENGFGSPFWSSFAQMNSMNAFPFSPSNTEAHSPTLVAQSGEPSFYKILDPQRLGAKLEPIPTQSPDAKFEPIPTNWPSLKMVPITSEPAAMPTLPAP